MKRVSLRYIAPITIAILVPLVTIAAPPFSGPSTQPTGGNVPGVIWNMVGGGTQSGAKINIDQGLTAYSATLSQLPIINFYDNLKLESGKAFHVDSIGSTNFSMGNWGSGQQPFTFNVYGDMKLNSIAPGGAGRNGQIDAQRYCIAGANCITAWPSGGGGTLTGVTAGTGITVSGSAPSPTINATDLYVNTTGDTMTGKLTMNWPGWRALEVNGGNGGGGAIFGNNTTAYGYGGEFYGSYGVYATTPNNSSGYYAGYFDGYSGGVNGIGRMAGGVGVMGQNSGASSYGVRGVANSGYGGLFQDSSYYAYIGGQGYGVLTNGQIYTTGNGYFGGAVTVNNGDLTINNSRNLCLGGVCKNAWPSVTDDYVNTTGDTMTGQLKLGITTLTPSQLQIQQPTNSSGAVIYSSNGTWGGKRTYAHLSNMSVAGEFGYVNSSNQEMTHTFIANSGSGVTGWARYGSGAAGGSFSYLDSSGNSQYRTDLGNASYAIDSTGPARFTGDVSLYGSTSDLSVGGWLGVGTTASYPLDVAGSMNLNKGISSDVAMRVNGAEALWYNGNYFSWGFGGSSNYFADPVGIGVISPSYQLQLSQNSAAKPASNVWTVASDKRLKDIHGTYDKGLDEITKLDPITYTYKKGNIYNYPSDTMSIGAVAQEVQKVFPEAVSTDKNGYLQLDTNAINWASINAFKELKAQNEALKAKNDDLEQRLERLEAKVGRLAK